MFKVLVDGKLICSSAIPGLALIDPVVNLEANKAGSFTFTFPADHLYKSIIEPRKSLIDVLQDESTIFEGIATESIEDFYGQISVTCEGDLTFLNDSVLRQHHYQGYTVANLLAAYIAEHNAQVDSFKQFTLGTVTVTGTATRYTNYNTTMKEISEDLLGDFGGYLRVRHENGVRYLDYLAESPNTNPQTIALGKNILSLKSNLETLDICTVLIPLGARQETQEVEGLDARLTIKSVNDNKDYIEATSAINTFGKIVKTHTWDDVTVAANLLTKGQNYLADAQYANLVIDVTAIDLGLASNVFEQFKVLDTVRIVSAPHGLDRNFVISKMSLALNSPESNTITLGKEIVQKLTSRSAETSNAIAAIDGSIISASAETYSRAVATATSLITTAMGGYVYKTTEALYIMDTADPQTATKVWRWNLGGLGYSSNGFNGPYGLAMTMDGSIVADYITTGALSADRITAGTLQSSDAAHKYSLDLTTGTVNMASANITGGSVNIVTDAETEDRIQLIKTPWANKISPLQVWLQNTETGRTAKHQAGGSYYRDGNDIVRLSMGVIDGGAWLAVKDADGTDASVLDSNGLTCHRLSDGAGEDVTSGGAEEWITGKTITVDKTGWYYVKARAQVKSASAYCHFAVGIGHSDASGVSYSTEYGSSATAVLNTAYAYQGTSIEVTQMMRITAGTNMACKFLVKGAGTGARGGAVGTWLEVTRIG